MFGFICLLCFGLFLNNRIKSLNITKLIIDLSLPIILISCYSLFFLLNTDVYLFFNFKVDNYFIFFKCTLFIFLFFCLYLSRFYFLLERMNIFEYTILILLSIQGTSLVLMSMNLFGIYIALELQNLCFYVLASLKRYSNFSTEAGLKYFLLGSFSSSLLLFGISLIYGFLGTVDLFDIFFILTNFNFEIIHILLILAIFFFLCGLLFKIGSVPFH
jgi:NADH-quinone oxidoreductase subunit N